jgi:hypothetical protein
VTSKLAPTPGGLDAADSGKTRYAYPCRRLSGGAGVRRAYGIAEFALR